MGDVKKILFVSYYFPPAGGAGVQRIAKFVKYLPQNKYQPVICAPDPKYLRYLKDASLIKDVSGKAKIYLVPIFDLNWIFKIFYGLRLNWVINWINQSLLFPGFQRQWNPMARRAIKRILRENDISLILITAPPYSNLLLLKSIRKISSVPIVFDLRDPFSLNHEELDPQILEKRKAFEIKLYLEADYLICNTWTNASNLQKTFGLDQSKIGVITNGYDDEDFTVKYRGKRGSTDNLIVSHIGRFYGEYNARPLLQAISAVKAEIESVEFRFIGGLVDQDIRFVKENGLEKLVKIIPYCNHDEALQYNRDSDVLLLIIPDDSWTYWIPGKTFEYIRSEKPILAIIPEESDCATVIRKTKTDLSILSPSKIREKPELLIQAFEDYKEPFVPDRQEIARYERKSLANELSLLFDELINRQRTHTS